MQERFIKANEENMELHKLSTKNQELEAQLDRSTASILSLKKDIETIKANHEKEMEVKAQKAQRELGDLRKKFRIVEQQRNQLAAQIDFDEKKSEWQKIEGENEGKSTSKPPGESFRFEYLKASLIQFFAQDEKTQEKMAPIIMEFIGIDEDEIKVIMSKWEASHKSVLSTIFGKQI